MGSSTVCFSPALGTTSTFREGAQLLSDVEENVVGKKFQAVNFPGRPPASQNWNLWAHATTREGATGILARGKADYQVAGLMPMRIHSHFMGAA